MLISWGEAITSGPVIAGDESGGTGVGAAAAAAGLLLAAGAGAAGAAAPGAVAAGADPSAQALCPPAVMRVRSIAHTSLSMVELPARCFISNFFSIP